MAETDGKSSSLGHYLEFVFEIPRQSNFFRRIQGSSEEARKVDREKKPADSARLTLAYVDPRRCLSETLPILSEMMGKIEFWMIF
jgi:hypothetical protein